MSSTVLSQYAEYPINPIDKMLVETAPGVVAQYDAASNSWIELTRTNLGANLATETHPGMMLATDFIKLNRLLIPPPQSTITAEGCNIVFGIGSIGLRSSDSFVQVSGISTLVAGGQSALVTSHLHQKTYTIDFTLNLNNLIEELIDRGQLVITGPVGPKGITGVRGIPGTNQLLTGPQGETGVTGFAPPCVLTIQNEIYGTIANPINNMVIVSIDVQTDPLDNTKYNIIAQRQAVGAPTATAGLLQVQNNQSSWVIALPNAGVGSQTIHYIDVEPIISQIHTKFINEMSRIKVGFESVVGFWLQTMSNLFDQQKAALCCALEHCKSKTSNTAVQQHVESIVATAYDKGILQVVVAGSGSTAIGTTMLDPTCVAGTGHSDIAGGTGLLAPQGITGAKHIGPPNECLTCFGGSHQPASLIVTDKYGSVLSTPSLSSAINTIYVAVTVLNISAVEYKIGECHGYIPGTDTNSMIVAVPVIYQLDCGSTIAIATGSPRLTIYYPLAQTGGNTCQLISENGVALFDDLIAYAANPIANPLPYYWQSVSADATYWHPGSVSDNTGMTVSYIINDPLLYSGGSNVSVHSQFMCGYDPISASITTCTDCVFGYVLAQGSHGLVVRKTTKSIPSIYIITDPYTTFVMYKHPDLPQYIGCTTISVTIGGLTQSITVVYTMFCDSANNLAMTVSYPSAGDAKYTPIGSLSGQVNRIGCPSDGVTVLPNPWILVAFASSIENCTGIEARFQFDMSQAPPTGYQFPYASDTWSVLISSGAVSGISQPSGVTMLAAISPGISTYATQVLTGCHNILAASLTLIDSIGTMQLVRYNDVYYGCRMMRLYIDGAWSTTSYPVTYLLSCYNGILRLLIGYVGGGSLTNIFTPLPGLSCNTVKLLEYPGRVDDGVAGGSFSGIGYLESMVAPLDPLNVVFSVNTTSSANKVNLVCQILYTGGVGGNVNIIVQDQSLVGMTYSGATPSNCLFGPSGVPPVSLWVVTPFGTLVMHKIVNSTISGPSLGQDVWYGAQYIGTHTGGSTAVGLTREELVQKYGACAPKDIILGNPGGTPVGYILSGDSQHYVLQVFWPVCGENDPTNTVVFGDTAVLATTNIIGTGALINTMPWSNLKSSIFILSGSRLCSSPLDLTFIVTTPDGFYDGSNTNAPIRILSVPQIITSPPTSVPKCTDCMFTGAGLADFYLGTPAGWCSMSLQANSAGYRYYAGSINCNLAPITLDVGPQSLTVTQVANMMESLGLQNIEKFRYSGGVQVPGLPSDIYGNPTQHLSSSDTTITPQSVSITDTANFNILYILECIPITSGGSPQLRITLTTIYAVQVPGSIDPSIGVISNWNTDYNPTNFVSLPATIVTDSCSFPMYFAGANNLVYAEMKSSTGAPPSVITLTTNIPSGVSPNENIIFINWAATGTARSAALLGSDWSGNLSAPTGAATPSGSTNIVSQALNETLVTIDASRHILSDKAVKLDIPAGTFSVRVIETTANWGGEHRLPLRVQYNEGATRRMKAFHDDRFTFKHTGGQVSIYVAKQDIVGSGTISIGLQQLEQPPAENCAIPVDQLKIIEKSWVSGNLNGALVTVHYQDYILFNLDNTDCGKCAIIYPTLDGISFVALPEYGMVWFRQNALLQSDIIKILNSGAYIKKGLGVEILPTFLVPEL